MGKGFLGTAASWAADLTLMTELGMGVALALGAMLARKRFYRAHACCQTTVVLLNLGVIAGYMLPGFRSQVFPVLRSRYADLHYLIATAHGFVGMVAELFAIYILLGAGTSFLPHYLRFDNYRSWMRGAFALWWLALLLGLATYLWWYVVPLYQ